MNGNRNTYTDCDLEENTIELDGYGSKTNLGAVTDIYGQEPNVHFCWAPVWTSFIQKFQMLKDVQT